MSTFRTEVLHQIEPVQHKIEQLKGANLRHFGPWASIARETLEEVKRCIKQGKIPVLALGRKSTNGELAAISTKVIDPQRLVAQSLWRLVAPSHQRQGLTSLLHDKELETLRALNVQRILSLAGTAEGRAFLVSAGYQERGRSRFELELKGETLSHP